MPLPSRPKKEPQGGAKPDGLRFSVVLPLFNKRRFIERTLRSALAQEHDSFEVVVVDDGSTDGSRELVAATADPRLRLIDQENAGPGPARNRGVAEAGGEWIAFLDADDIWLPEHLATLEQLIRDFPQADAVASGFRRHPADRPLPPSGPRASSRPGRLLNYFTVAAEREPFWTSCTAVRRETCRALGGFGAFWPGEDIDFWARLAMDHPIAVSPVETALYITETGGLMDSWESEADRPLELQPVYTTLNEAIRDPRRAALHEALCRYRRALLRRGARQAIYRGWQRQARDWLRELRRSGGRPSIILQLATLLPAPALRVAAGTYSGLKRRLAGER